MRFCVIFALVLVQVYSSKHKRPTAETSLGSIRGHYKRSYGGRNFAAFEGIPYAKPPIGDLRFKIKCMPEVDMYCRMLQEPKKCDRWTGIWDATTEYECPQISLTTSQVIGYEDCLYLSVYVPRENPIPSENLDVIVYIHGGGFMFANPALGGPEYLMDRDIVYVTINYRLGILGFLSTEDDVVSGNNGMKDQSFALKWVQKHIDKFGGNPKSVTILGLSAGGAAVHLHYFSQLSKGLFHRGISQSGTALAPWAIQEAPLEKARKLASLVGCDYPSTKEFVNCLRQRSVKQLIENTIEFHGYGTSPFAPFAPSIEKKSKNAFLTEHPYQLLKKGHVHDLPWITSITTEEGVYGVITVLEKLETFEKDWDKAIPHFLDYNYTVADSKKAVVAQEIKKFYLQDKPLKEDIDSFLKIISDRHFTINFEKSARMQAKVNKAPVYSYIYGYQGEQTLSSLFKLEKNYGVGHGEDGFLLHYATLIGITLKKDKLSESDEIIKDILVDLVTSFAKNGKPSAKGVNWEPVKHSDDFGYLSIKGPNETNMKYRKEIGPTNFWNQLPIREDENCVMTKDEL